MKDSITQYRSGLLMGLTVAETLLLTLFLLLLLFSAFFIKGKAQAEKKDNQIAFLEEKKSQLEKERTRLTNENKLLEDLKQKIEVAIGSGESFDDFFKELTLARHLESKIQDLQEKNSKIVEQNEILKRQKQISEDLNKKYEPILAEIKKIYPDEKDAISLSSEKMRQLCEIEKSGGKDIKSIIAESKEFKNKNEDLNKQLIHLVELQKGLGKGADYPPCWLDDNNKIEYIFNVVIDDFGIEVFDIKNENRREEKIKLPIHELDYGKNLPIDTFLSSFRPLFDVCVENNCRHFVRIYDETTQKETFKKNLLTVETYFYKFLTKSKFYGKRKVTEQNSRVGSIDNSQRTKEDKNTRKPSQFGEITSQTSIKAQKAI